VDFQGRVKAERVTGPMGAFVQGTPPPAQRSSYDSGSGYSDDYDSRPQRNHRGGGGGGGGRGGGGYQQRSPRREYQPASTDYSYNENTFDTFGSSERIEMEEDVKYGGRGAPGDVEFHELDIPENDPDDNAEAEKESSSGKDASEASAAIKY
jgi:hypothetical protein